MEEIASMRFALKSLTEKLNEAEKKMKDKNPHEYFDHEAIGWYNWRRGQCVSMLHSIEFNDCFSDSYPKTNVLPGCIWYFCARFDNGYKIIFTSASSFGADIPNNVIIAKLEDPLDSLHDYNNAIFVGEEFSLDKSFPIKHYNYPNLKKFAEIFGYGDDIIRFIRALWLLNHIVKHASEDNCLKPEHKRLSIYCEKIFYKPLGPENLNIYGQALPPVFQLDHKA